MITGNGSLSLRKKDLENQKVPALGFKKTTFAHKATAGQTGINLSSLTVPTELTSNGFVQPSGAELANAQLLFYRNNLKLISSARGVLMDFVSYTLASSTQINFLGFTALEGEIFYGVIDYNAQTGLKVVDASPIVATGTVAANATDFNSGTPFKVNQYPSYNVGAVLVYVDRVLQQRNTGNSSTVQDKDYYEVDAGGGLGTIIRFNTTDPDNSREITLISNGLLAERPDGSMMAVIEALAGYVDNVTGVVAALSGLSTASVKGAAPTNVDLKNFGDRVFALESNRARIDQANTWTSAQNIPGRSDGSTPGAGIVGERVSWLTAPVDQVVTTTETDWTNANVILTPGRWKLVAEVAGSIQTGSGTAVDVSNIVTVTDSANAKVGDMARVLRVSWSSATAGSVGQYGVMAMSHIINVTATSTFKIRVSRNDGGAIGTANVFNTGPTLKSNFYAERMP